MSVSGVGVGESFQLPIQEESSQAWTNAKILTVALYLFARILLIGAIVMVGLGIQGIVLPAVAWVAMPLAMLALGMIYWAGSILDYEDPKKLREMRVEAHNMSFRDLYEKHGGENLGQYIAKEEGPTLETLSEKFLSEETKVERIVDTYNIQELEACGLITQEHRNILEALAVEKKAADVALWDDESRIDRRYSFRQEKLFDRALVNAAAEGIEGMEVAEHKEGTSAIMASMTLSSAKTFGSSAQKLYNRDLEEAREEREAKLLLLQARYDAFKAQL